MTLVSLTAYAASHNVKKQSAAEWKTRGYLVTVGDQIDQEASDERMRGAAKGRFRVKGHGGRRQAGVRGLRDRPGLKPAPVPAPWLTWHPPGNPNTLHGALREAIDAGDTERLDELLGTFAHDDWERERIYVGWHRWPKVAAPAIAASLGLAAGRVGGLEAALQGLVDQRLRDTGYPPEDLDHGLEPL